MKTTAGCTVDSAPRDLESSCRSLPRDARHTAKTRTRVALDRSGLPKPLILQDAAIPITRSILRLRQAMHGNELLSKILIARETRVECRHGPTIARCLQLPHRVPADRAEPLCDFL
jgi:hypothetical protein